MITAEDLNQVSVFACLEDSERERLAGRAADMRLRNGDWLAREGEQPYFCVLLEGRVKLYKSVLGRDQELYEYKVGDFFGEVPILLGAPLFASARAHADGTRVARFEPQQLRELIQTSAACSALILQTMTSRLNKVQQFASEVPAARVLVVGSQYDLDCREIRNFLTMNRIPYEWIDRERDPDRVPKCMPADLSGPAVVVDRAFCVGQPPTVRKVADALGLRTAPKQKEHEVYDVVVVGGGPAGLAAAVYGASEGLCVLMVERNAAGGQAGTSSRIENYLGFPNGISGDDLSERAVQQAVRFNAEIVLTREVKNIFPIPMDDNRGGYCVELDGGDRVRAKAVILATGVDWRRLQAEGVDRLIGRGVLYGASKTEASTVVGKDVFIVGGGNSAGQAAMFFANYANSVTVVVRGAGLSFSMSQYLIDQIKSKCNIKVEPFSHVISAGGEDHLETICTQRDGEPMQTRKADALFVLIGADAATDWLPKNLERDERGYICTGRDLVFLAGGPDSPEWKGRRPPFLLETNLPGFFCVGDVRHDSIKRVSSGVGEGSMAIAFVHQYLAQRDTMK
jgi:thioredoxin reductase (NADPH)